MDSYIVCPVILLAGSISGWGTYVVNSVAVAWLVTDTRLTSVSFGPGTVTVVVTSERSEQADWAACNLITGSAGNQKPRLHAISRGARRLLTLSI